MYDFNAQRLYVDAPLAAGRSVEPSADQASYLLNVLRLSEGATILLFNGREGEWLATVSSRSKRACTLAVHEQTRAQSAGPDIEYLFAPLKRSRLDYMVQKAVELGAARLRPVVTRRTIAERVNLDRMRANVVEAAEQCGILSIPEVCEPVKLDRALAGWSPDLPLVFCDEAAQIASPLSALEGLHLPLAVLIGPEGGFDPAEREMLLAKPFTRTISLGPRIMRADTAAVAALSLVQAVAGDWR